jgi:hypothetical protein
MNGAVVMVLQNVPVRIIYMGGNFLFQFFIQPWQWCMISQEIFVEPIARRKIKLVLILLFECVEGRQRRYYSKAVA